MLARVGQPRRTERSCRPPPRSTGRRRRLRIPARRARSSSAVAGSSLASVSRMTHARWPSSVAAARSVSARSAASVAAAIDDRQRAVGPGRAPSGHPARRRRSAGRGAAGRARRRPDRGRVAGRRGSSSRSSSRRAGAPSATGCRRAARARPSDRARRAIPLPYGWASESTVIQSPASRAARRRSCQVRSVSRASVRSRRPKANQRASSSASWKRRSATNRSGVGRSPRVALRKPRWTAASSGQRTPWTAPMPGATRCCPAR